MATVHNKAKKDQIARTVLMPGDPLRSRYVAENFLTDPVLVNDVRGVQGYTGSYKGVPVTARASGMGMPSIGIYSWELFNQYYVDNIIRIGTTGALQDDMKLRDVVLGQGACTDSNYTRRFGVTGSYAPLADYALLRTAEDCAVEMGLNVRIGNILSSDMFYYPAGADETEAWKKLGVLGIEMEAAALYTNAAYFRKRALCIATVTDHMFRPDYLSAKERQTSMDQMILLALETAVAMETRREK